MKISIAKTAGFCMGVRRAVDMVLDASNLAASSPADDPIYTYGPLIHNPQVLEMLESKEIHRMDHIPEKGKGIVLIRAHGVPPEDETALSDAGFTVINATCPRVTRVQVIINKYAKKGYATIIIGDKKHPEVVGLLGYARGKGHTVTAMEQLEALPRFDKAVVVAQTTQNTRFYDKIKTWCRSHAPHYELFDTICGSTEKRQNEIRDLAETHDAVIVVGGKESGNTRRLAQVARETGTPATHIEDVTEIDYNSLTSARSIAITAGASTPNWIIKDTCLKVTQAFQGKRKVFGRLANILGILMKTNLLLGAGAACLTYGAAVIRGGGDTHVHAAIAMLYVLAMQIMNNMLTVRSDTYNKPDRAAFYRRFKPGLKVLAVVSGLVSLCLAYSQGPGYFIVVSAMTLLGLSYNLKCIPLFPRGLRFHRIKDVPGSKTILVAVAWGIVTSLLPAMVDNSPLILTGISFLFATGLAFSRAAFADILAVQGDRIAGRETLPILLGEKKSLRVIRWAIGGAMAMPVCGFFLTGTGFWLALIPVCMFLLTRLYREDRCLSGSPYELMFESSFLLAGVLAAVI